MFTNPLFLSECWYFPWRRKSKEAIPTGTGVKYLCKKNPVSQINNWLVEISVLTANKEKQLNHTVKFHSALPARAALWLYSMNKYLYSHSVWLSSLQPFFGLPPASQPAFWKEKDDADGYVGKKSGACTVLGYSVFGWSPHLPFFPWAFSPSFYYSKLFSCQPIVIRFACQVDESDGIFLARGALVSQWKE